MPIDTFEPFRNAMAGSVQAAQTKYNVGQQQIQNAMAQRRQGLQERQLGMQERAFDAEMLQNIPGYAQKILNAPEELQGPLYNTVLNMFGVQDAPEWGTPEASTMVQAYAQMAPEQVIQLTGDAANLRGVLGRTPTVEELMEYRGKGATQISVGDRGPEYGKISEGMVRVADPESPGGVKDVPITGSKIAEERKLSEEAEKNKAQAMQAKVESVTNTIDDVLDDTSSWTTGLVGALSAQVPGTPAHNLAINLQTIEANLAFDRLQEMREMSKTGGALGQVSERELALLKSAQAALAQSQSEEQFRRNLMRVRQHYKNLEKLYTQDYLKGNVDKITAEIEAPKIDGDIATMSDEDLLKGF